MASRCFHHNLLAFISHLTKPGHFRSSPMHNIHPWVLSISLLLLLCSAASESDDVKRSLIAFLNKLSVSNAQIAQDLCWNASTDPCIDEWKGIVCDNRRTTVRRVILESLQLGGFIDASLICRPPALTVISLGNNSLQGNLPAEISNCSQLTHLLIGGNRLSGSLPSSLSSLNNLKKFDISDNRFSGGVPEGLAKISGLVTFLVQNNKLNGSIPQFHFDNLQRFNVSNNLFTGPITEGGDRFGIDSYAGNPGLCGEPVDEDCPPNPAPFPLSEDKSKTKSNGEKALLVSGYVILALFILLFVVYKCATRKKTSRQTSETSETMKKNKKKKKASSASSTRKTSRSDYSISSNENVPTGASMSLVVLKNPAVKELRFEELLKAPAELLGRGRFGSLYKVMMADGTMLAVKRIKDWTVSAQEFQMRMERLDRTKHPGVLPAVAFYCSKQEKLVVYEYKPNGSLFNLLHGGQGVCTFDWSSRLSVAAGIAEGLAFMHRELNEVGVGHGNLKSSNILMDNNMQPCISEYGLLAIPKQQSLPPLAGSSNGRRKSVNLVNDSALKADIYGFGVILLEMLTGKLVQNNGFDLAQWVHSVVREEWTAEVFDKALVSEGVIEESMVRLLQVALKCIDSSPDARPAMSQVARMIRSLMEEDDRSEPSEIDSRET